MAPSRDDLLQALGLTGCELGEVETVEWPEPAVGHALGLTRRDLSAIAATLRVVPIGAALLGSIGVYGFTAADASGIVKLVGKGPVAVRLAGPAEGRTFRSEGEPNVAWIDANHSGPFLVETDHGRLLCSVERGQLHLQALVAPAALAPLAEIAEPADGWMRSSRDGWLQAQAVRTLETRGSWSVCAAAGQHGRLADPAAFGDPREMVEAQLEGDAPGWLSAPRRWVRSLEPEQASTMSRLALAEVDRLSELADHLERADPETGDWLEDWRRLCHARDDLEGVRVLLAERGISADVDAHVATLDRAGRSLRVAAPLARLGRDERLRRASLVDPDAWWGWLG
jgi:hypothetical protein